MRQGKKNFHISVESMEFHIHQLWLYKMLLWVMDGFWVEILFCQHVTPSRKAQRAGISTNRCRPRTWGFPNLPYGTSSCAGIPGDEASSRQGSAGHVSSWTAPRSCWSENCLVPALLMGARDRGLSWLVLPALDMKAKNRAQNKFAYIKKRSLYSQTYAQPESLWHLLKLGLPYTCLCHSLNPS